MARKWIVAGSTVLAVLAGLLGASPASAGEGDELTRLRIQARIERAELDRDAHVEVAVNEGRATLSGAALTLHARNEIERQALKVTHEVENRIRVVPEAAPDPKLIREQAFSAILSYPYYGVFDSVELGVDDAGAVLLAGSVQADHRRDEIEKRITRIPGVTSVTNRIAVQSASIYDEQLRWQLVRAIYGDSRFVQYQNRVDPPIRIVVDRGRVTLTGVVASRVEQAVVGHIARGVLSFGVDNRLLVEGEQPVEPTRSATS